MDVPEAGKNYRIHIDEKFSPALFAALPFFTIISSQHISKGHKFAGPATFYNYLTYRGMINDPLNTF